ncbi:MAG: 3-phosphoshikimate 1-carboxyvinyltransferase [Treponema sp.]|jgi:3-phosphoshikimate 1-carboxyvinyltransferase|nr:3-phosphoshikimate 1-carboxyvinyltransferase [Treponema sp.]
MRVLIAPHVFTRAAAAPASKSHTIRRLMMAALTGGVSTVEYPLDSLDAQSCAAACRVLGAAITEERDPGGRLCRWTVRGQRPDPRPGADQEASPPPEGAAPSGAARERLIHAGNSGTTLFFAIAAAALGREPVTFTGDAQIARRGAGPLLDALAGLGVSTLSSPGPREEGGCVPITVRGPWRGGRVSVSCPTSQYLSALLLAAPLAPAGTITEIGVPLLNERPYVEMTLSYLKAQGLWGGGGTPGVEFTPDFSWFRAAGGASYTPMNGPVPGDFSSAAFPAAAAAISGGTAALLGLDPEDIQGDKVFFDYLAHMGCDVRWERLAPVSSPGDKAAWRVTVSRTGPLRGGTFDLNAAPDLLPVMAVLGAFAQGKTVLTNAAHARIKETDRVAVMAGELGKLGVRREERPGGLVIHGPRRGDGGNPRAGAIKGGERLDGRGDHRVVMALACAALGADRPVEIDGAEAVDVSYPGFWDLLGTAER